jgi:hypothetical protein
MSVERVAARQWGVVSRVQALEAGLTRHQIAQSNMTTADAARLTTTTLGCFGRSERRDRPNGVGGGKVG